MIKQEKKKQIKDEVFCDYINVSRRKVDHNYGEERY